MAASLNKVILIGNLTRDPDLRSLPNGTSVCEFGLAMNRRFTGSNGQDTEETTFVDIVVWGRSAENCRQYLEKGSQVLIEGRLKLDQWEDRNGGGKRSRLQVVAEQVQFLNRRSGDGGNYQQQGGGNYQQPQGNYQQGGNNGYQQNNYPPQGGGNYQQQGNFNNSRPAAMPRQQAPQGAPGSMPRQQPPMPQPPTGGAAPEMPPMPQNAFNPDEGMEDDIPF